MRKFLWCITTISGILLGGWLLSQLEYFHPARASAHSQANDQQNNQPNHQNKNKADQHTTQNTPSITKETVYPSHLINPFNYLEPMFQQQAPTLSSAVIHNTLTTLHCAQTLNINHNPILTIIDYSKPSNEKRLWVFDLYEKKLLFHTYIAHGIKSGTLYTGNFSNQHNSKASSIGVYITGKAYHGREGMALKLEGLDRGLNDNAANRSIVMHGGWYLNEEFIKNYGRPGRSWGCPALPMDLTKSIINRIKENALMIIYYPTDEWLLKSKFLNCDAITSLQTMNEAQNQLKPNKAEPENREDILFLDLNGNGQHEENDPVLAINATRYKALFNQSVPVGRLLRRPIDQTEYVVLTSSELKRLLENQQGKLPHQSVTHFKEIELIVPEIKMLRGYYVTEMKKVHVNEIEDIQLVDTSNDGDSFSIKIKDKPIMHIKTCNHFIRWIGL